MLIRKAPDLRYSDITPKSLYLRRREFLQTAAGAAIGAAAAAVAFTSPDYIPLVLGLATRASSVFSTMRAARVAADSSASIGPNGRLSGALSA